MTIDIDDITAALLLVDENHIHEIGRSAGESIATMIGDRHNIGSLSPKEFAEAAMVALRAGRGAAANAFLAGMVSGMDDVLSRPGEDD